MGRLNVHFFKDYPEPDLASLIPLFFQRWRGDAWTNLISDMETQV